MRKIILAASVVAAAVGVGSSILAQPQGQGSGPWGRCCGMSPWSMGLGMKGQGGMMGRRDDEPRNVGQHAATPYGYDVQYSGPLQRVEKPAVANACDSRTR
jgi:hypothetical protein